MYKRQLRCFSLHRLRLRHPFQQRDRLAVSILTCRPWCTAANSNWPDEELSCAGQSTAVWTYPDYRKWKDEEEEILRDIEPITLLMKEIVHSNRLMGISRCLFVIRTDGGWRDLSYWKCLRAYIRRKYPSHAERFIKGHLNRGSA